MSDWSIYVAATGIFLPHQVTCSNAADLAANTPPDCAAIAGRFDPLSQRVDLANHQVVDYIPPAPADDPLFTWAWHADTKRWHQVPTLAAIKARQWDAVKADRDAAIDRPITVPQGKFDHDQAGRDAILELKARADRLMAAGKDGSAEVTTFDNATVTLTAAQITNLWEKSDTRKQDALKKGRALRAQIVAAADAATVAAVVWA